MSDDTPAPTPKKPPRDRPSIKVIPPKLAGMALLAGIVLNFIVPLRPFDYWTAFFIGLFLALPGAAFARWGFRVFADKGTDFRVTAPASCIVTSGPYAFTRNPIYVGGALLYAGLALLFDSGWALLFLIPVMYILHTRVVLPEEAYLEKKFGAAYLDYKNKVKRWL